MKALICGSRDYRDAESVRVVLSLLPRGTEIITGGALGVDTIVATYAEQYGHTVQIFPAFWRKYGRQAGPMRNRRMLDEKPDVVIGIHPFIINSKGTKDCMRESERRGIPTFVIKNKEDAQGIQTLGAFLAEREK